MLNTRKDIVNTLGNFHTSFQEIRFSAIKIEKSPQADCEYIVANFPITSSVFPLNEVTKAISDIPNIIVDSIKIVNDKFLRLDLIKNI